MSEDDTVTEPRAALGARDERHAEIAPGTRLVIVRHGEAVCNASEFIGGHQSCRGLTRRGAAQAELLARRLERSGELAKATAFYTSILPRAVETAQIISGGVGGLVATQRCSLCERHPGEADGLTWGQYEQRYARTSLPTEDADLPLSPGGESWSAFVRRAESALVDVALAHPGELIVVVAHGGVIDSSMIRFLGLAGDGAGTRLHPEHTSLTEWQHIGTKWRLVRYNDAAHFADPDTREVRSPTPLWVERDPSFGAVEVNGRPAASRVAPPGRRGAG